MKNRVLAVFLFFLTVAFTSAGAAATGAATRTDTPETLLREGVGKLTAFIKSGRAANRQQAMAFLEREITPYFDFAYMTRWAAGPAWRRMSPQQRARTEAQLTRAFLTTLVQKLASYDNQQIRFFTPRGRSRDEVTVSAWIMQPSGYPTKLDFRFYPGENGWKIFDVKAGGNSAVVHYRQMFRENFREARYPRGY